MGRALVIFLPIYFTCCPFLVFDCVIRRCVEYDLQLCSVRMGLSSADLPVRIELTARPTAVLWHPRIGDDAEDR